MSRLSSTTDDSMLSMPTAAASYLNMNGLPYWLSNFLVVVVKAPGTFVRVHLNSLMDLLMLIAETNPQGQ